MHTITRRDFLASAALVTAGLTINRPLSADTQTKKYPNIVYILSDDQGYGDTKSFNPDCGFPTPGIDRLAKEGMRFTDAHSASAVCTPTRYALLTGRYAWRTRLQNGVLQTGVDSLISTKTLTVQKMLKAQGYKTACIGKWHLGFRYDMPKGKKPIKEKGKKVAIPVGSKIIDGPLTRDFDHYHGFHHAGEMRTWIEQDSVIKNFESQQMLPHICKSATDYIHQRGKKEDGPFFLYIPFNSPHGPIVPTKQWQGKSGINLHADYVMQTDDVIRQILESLDKANLTDNTIVFFTTDNGTSPAANFKQMRAKGHDPSAGLRGHKADAWDGGHRVPFVVRWPGTIKPSSTSNQLICHNNLMATCAEILNINLPEDAAPDSFSILPILSSNQPTSKPTHPYVIHHSIKGHFAIRKNNWKFVACKGSGGWSKGDDGKPAQLYDMATDRPEQNNLIESKTEIAKQLANLLEQAIQNGRTTPGKKLKNDVPVNLWKTKKGRPELLK